MRKSISGALAIGFACTTLLAAPAYAADAPRPALKHYVFMVLTDPVAGKDAEYNEWYTNVHLHDLVKIPGIKSAQRFKLAPISAADGKQHYLAIYDIETDDVSKVKAAIGAAAGTPAMMISPALDNASASAIFYEQITPKVVAAH